MIVTQNNFCAHCGAGPDRGDTDTETGAVRFTCGETVHPIGDGAYMADAACPSRSATLSRLSEALDGACAWADKTMPLHPDTARVLLTRIAEGEYTYPVSDFARGRANGLVYRRLIVMVGQEHYRITEWGKAVTHYLNERYNYVQL